jgi:hypothetical protein
MFLSISGDYVEVSCVPSTTYVPCVLRSQNKVLGISMRVTLFFKLLYT